MKKPTINMSNIKSAHEEFDFQICVCEEPPFLIVRKLSDL